MAIKYIVLAFLAIQAINAGVIKLKASESDFDDLHAEILEYASKTSYLTKAVELAYDRTKNDLVGVAYMVAMASHTVLDAFEQNVIGDAPWAAKCFENVHDLVDEISKVLLANTNECINSAKPTVEEHLKTTINFQENVKSIADQVKEDWDKCSDSQCQDDVLKTGRGLLNGLFDPFVEMRDNINVFLKDDFKDMRQCAQSAAEEHYYVHLKEITDNVQKCIDAGP